MKKPDEKINQLHLGKLPFYFGVQDSPCASNFPHSLPITLMFNRDLGLIAQKANQKVDIWVKKAYNFSSSLSTPLGEGTFGKERAEDVINGLRYSLGSRGFKGRSFLEVGCNRGHLLYMLKRKGAAYCLGVDPYPASNTGAKKYGIDIIQSFFNPKEIKKKFDVVFTHGVLEHIQNPLEFLGGLKASTRDGGIIFTAVPDCKLGLSMGDLSLPVHEHYNYFTFRSLSNLYQRLGLEAIKHRSANCGWMLYIWGRQKSARASGFFGNSFKRDVAKEEGLFNDYARAYGNIIDKVQRMIDCFQTQGKAIGIYGANCEFLSFKWRKPPRFFDTDKAKHGRYLPGCSNPIECPDSLIRKPVDKIWIAPINHDSAIRDFLENKLKIPADKIVSMKEVYESEKDGLK